MQADKGVRRGIHQPPKLILVGSKAELGHAAGRVAVVANGIPLTLRKVSCSRSEGAEHCICAAVLMHLPKAHCGNSAAILEAAALAGGARSQFRRWTVQADQP